MGGGLRVEQRKEERRCVWLWGGGGGRGVPVLDSTKIQIRLSWVYLRLSPVVGSSRYGSCSGRPLLARSALLRGSHPMGHPYKGPFKRSARATALVVFRGLYDRLRHDQEAGRA